MGESPLSEDEIREVIFDAMEKWPANSYHPTSRNCVHFARALVEALKAPETFPDWVSGLAELGNSTVSFPVVDWGWRTLRWWHTEPEACEALSVAERPPTPCPSQHAGKQPDPDLVLWEEILGHREEVESGEKCQPDRGTFVDVRAWLAEAEAARKRQAARSLNCPHLWHELDAGHLPHTMDVERQPPKAAPHMTTGDMFCVSSCSPKALGGRKDPAAHLQQLHRCCV